MGTEWNFKPGKCFSLPHPPLKKLLRDWRILTFHQKPTISFHLLPQFVGSHLVARFGSSVIHQKDQLFIIGGVIKDRILKSSEELCTFKINANSASVEAIPLVFNPRPLLIGSTTISTGNSLVVTGGSAVCFSFGTFWNEGNYTIALPDSKSAQYQGTAKHSEVWRLLRTVAAEVPAKAVEANISTEPVSITRIPRVHLGSAADFSRILESSTPVIIEKADIGPCTTKWTMDYLKEKVGPEREVSIPTL